LWTSVKKYIVIILQLSFFHPDVKNGEIATVLIDDEVTLKQVYYYGDTLSLLPANPRFPSLVFNRRGRKNIRILGRAVAFLIELN
jgi:repressor LexA